MAHSIGETIFQTTNIGCNANTPSKEEILEEPNNLEEELKKAVSCLPYKDTLDFIRNCYIGGTQSNNLLECGLHPCFNSILAALAEFLLAANNLHLSNVQSLK